MTARCAVAYLAALALPLIGVPGSLAAQAPGADVAAPAEPQTPPPPLAPLADPRRAAAERAWFGPFTPAEPSRKQDPLFPTAIAELALAGGMLVAGGVLWGTATGEERCGALAGCIEVLSDDAAGRREAGVALVGLGSGFAVFGGLSLGLLAAVPLEPGEERDAPGAAVTGHLLFAAGLSTFAAGFVHGAAADSRTVDYARPWPFYLVGLTAAAVGIPLFVGGVSREDEDERYQERLRSRRGRKARALPTTLTIGPTGGAAAWAW